MTSSGESSLDRFLVELSARTPAPGGGSAAAAAVAMAASLCAMAARFSEPATAEGGLVRHAEELRDVASGLCGEDRESYRTVLDAYRAVADDSPSSRRERLVAAKSQASDVPLRIVQTGTEVARLAASLTGSASQFLVGDAHAAVLLARAGTGAAAALVELNLVGSPTDDRLDRVRTLLDEVESAVAVAQSVLVGSLRTSCGAAAERGSRR